jgi:Ala-tRNA(Pro) deacylase
MASPDAIDTFMRRLGFEFATLRHPAAATALEEAEAAHVPPHEWAKTVVYFNRTEPILAVLPATCRVDPDRLQTLAGAAHLRKAAEKELVRLYPACEPGAMPPLGPLYGQRVFVDERLAQDEYVAFSAGTHSDAIRMRYRDFAELVHPAVGRFAVQR